MTKEKARKILIEYVKACREDDMPTLEKFEYEEILEAMSMGAASLSTLEPSEDLEDAAKNYTDSSEWLIGENLEHIDNAFIAGAKWQKQQMLKDAMEGHIIDAGFDDGTAFVTLNIPDKRYDRGDKVKIVIIPEKEEEK